MDTRNEAAIQKALDNLMEGRTTLTIAHRLSSVIGANRILVLDEGATWWSRALIQELVAAGGVYTQLMANQQTVQDGRHDGHHAPPAPVAHTVASVQHQPATHATREPPASLIIIDTSTTINGSTLWS